MLRVLCSFFNRVVGQLRLRIFHRALYGEIGAPRVATIKSKSKYGHDYSRNYAVRTHTYGAMPRCGP